MPRINLLPWREGQRKERKLAFSVALGVAAIAAGLTTFIVYIAFGSMVEGQEARNEKLRGEIKAVDKQIEEINNLESSKQKFIARMTIIEQLQRSRPEIVHVFDEIVKTLPDGVYLTSVKQNVQQVEVRGRRPVEHPRVLFHAQHRFIGLAEESGARGRTDEQEHRPRLQLHADCRGSALHTRRG